MGEETALILGLDLDYYWDNPPVVFNKHIGAFNAKRQMAMMDTDMTNHILGRYIAYAVNDPQHYPQQQKINKDFFKKKEVTVMTDSEMERVMKNNTLIIGGKIKNET